MTAPAASVSAARVSVALCTFNGEKFLRQQIDSILSQSRPVDEIVICDDGSTDTTAAIVQELTASASPVITLHINPGRLGITKNFEKAISLCTGDIIFLCDQDDRWQPDKVRIFLGEFETTAAAMVFSNAQIVDENLAPSHDQLWESVWFNRAEQQHVQSGDAVPVLLRHAVAAGCTLAFRSHYRPLLLPIPDLPHSHDIWITLLLACVGKIHPVSQDLIQYRLHDNNEVGMRRFGLLDQLRMARQQIQTNTFAFLAQLHIAAYGRLNNQTNWPVDRRVLDIIEEKIRHSQIRNELPAHRFAKLLTIAKELRAGNYRKYSYGFKSVLQDLFLR